MTLMMLSDSEPFKMLQQLDQQFPRAMKMGCIGAWTPFECNRPFTLFFNDEIHSGGAVGLALLSDKHDDEVRIASSIDLESFGNTATITK
jgi:hypothetical protein